MQVVLMEKAEDDLSFWKKSGQFKTLKRISALVSSISKSPKIGVGNPVLFAWLLVEKNKSRA